MPCRNAYNNSATSVARKNKKAGDSDHKQELKKAVIPTINRNLKKRLESTL